MEHAYEYTLREYCRAVNRRWCKRMYQELDAFSSDLYDWLYDHFENPRPDWRRRYQQFVDEQSAAGRIMAPESQQELLAFLEDWASRPADQGPPEVEVGVTALETSWPALSEEDRRRERGSYGLPGWYAKSLEWGDAEWEKVFEDLARTAQGHMLNTCRQLDALGRLAKEFEQRDDDRLDEFEALKQGIQGSYNAYVLSLIAIQRQWLAYLNKSWFIGLPVGRLMRRLDADLPPRLFDLSSPHTKDLAAILAEVNKAQAKLTSRVEVAYTAAYWTDNAIMAFQALTGVLGGARIVFTAAIKKGLTKALAQKLAVKFAVKQFAIQATIYVTAGYTLPPLIAASGLNQDFVFTGLMILQSLGAITAVRDAKITAGNLKPKLDATPDLNLTPRVVDNDSVELSPGKIHRKLEEADEKVVGEFKPGIEMDFGFPVGGDRGVWGMKDSLKRGEIIEKRLGQNLPQPFKVFDKFSDDGVATSIKSMDLWLKTYQNPAAIFSAGKKYIEEVVAFERESRNNVTITAEQIRVRRLELAIPPLATSSQRGALDALIEYGQRRNVVVEIKEIVE